MGYNDPPVVIKRRKKKQHIADIVANNLREYHREEAAKEARRRGDTILPDYSKPVPEAPQTKAVPLFTDGKDPAGGGPKQKQVERPQGVVPPRRKYELVDDIDPFELFAAYHLGLTADDKHKIQNIHDLARRFRTSAQRINQALKEYEIDSETVMNTDFDITMAAMDIQVAPEGVSRTALARQLYEDFRNSPRIPRNWENELQEDAEANRKIFGK